MYGQTLMYSYVTFFHAIPKNIKNFAIWVYPYEDVGNCDKLKTGFFCIWEKHLRFPNGFYQCRVCEVKRLGHVLILHSWIIPPLPQVGVGGIVLKNKFAVISHAQTKFIVMRHVSKIYGINVRYLLPCFLY